MVSTKMYILKKWLLWKKKSTIFLSNLKADAMNFLQVALFASVAQWCCMWLLYFRFWLQIQGRTKSFYDLQFIFFEISCFLFITLTWRTLYRRFFRKYLRNFWKDCSYYLYPPLFHTSSTVVNWKIITRLVFFDKIL